jgi:RNA 2',3'-cyclic 3'-phosphodiesterase
VSAGRPLRLFFALWPDAGVRAALAATAAELRTACGGRVPLACKLHLTLAFLGSVPAARLPELEDIAAETATQPACHSSMLTLDRIGWWRRSRLVWAGVQHCPNELDALAAALADKLRARGFVIEQRRFRPHVTLIRDADRVPAQTTCGPISWRARQFVLACAQPGDRGVEYQVVGNWRLKDVSAGL